MNIEALVKKHMNESDWYNFPEESLREALTEQAEAFKGELQSYDGMVRELTKTVEDMQAAQSVAVVGDDIPQDWKGVDGAVAWHLIDRHGEGWAHIGQMMDAWLAANSITAAELATLREKAAEADELRKEAERLQFMIDETAILMYSVGIDRTLCRVEWPLTGYVQDAFYPSERAAIDAAIAKENGK